MQPEPDQAPTGHQPRFSWDSLRQRPESTHWNQNPSSARLQLAKQGFCFSWDSDQPPRFAQEEISQKPEPQLKQTRSSPHKTSRCQPGEAGQPSESLKSLESLGFPKSAGCSFSTGPAGSAAPATPSIWEVNNSVNSPPLA